LAICFGQLHVRFGILQILQDELTAGWQAQLGFCTPQTLQLLLFKKPSVSLIFFPKRNPTINEITAIIVNDDNKKENLFVLFIPRYSE
jgi:hypothetical protein